MIARQSEVIIFFILIGRTHCYAYKRFIFSSGLIIRNIGLDDKELSPVKVAFKLLDDKSPAKSLTPVPEFPSTTRFLVLHNDLRFRE